MTITINNKEYKLKYTIRALFIFEQITERPFEIRNTMDNYLFFYCMILANNPDCLLEWDEFIDAMDNDASLITQLNQVVVDSTKKNELFNEVTEENGEKKKLSVSELYAILTLRLHYPPEYVLDKMELYEVKAVMEYEYLSYKDSWEQSRLIAYMIAQTNSTKRLKLTDILKFQWEKEDADTAISNEDVARLREKAKQYENLITE